MTFTDGGGSTLEFLSGQLVLAADSFVFARPLPEVPDGESVTLHVDVGVDAMRRVEVPRQHVGRHGHDGFRIPGALQDRQSGITDGAIGPEEHPDHVARFQAFGCRDLSEQLIALLDRTEFFVVETLDCVCEIGLEERHEGGERPEQDVVGVVDEALGLGILEVAQQRRGVGRDADQPRAPRERRRRGLPQHQQPRCVPVHAPAGCDRAAPLARRLAGTIGHRGDRARVVLHLAVEGDVPVGHGVGLGVDHDVLAGHDDLVLELLTEDYAVATRIQPRSRRITRAGSALGTVTPAMRAVQ